MSVFWPGKKTIQIDEEDYDYEGELDENGVAVGNGVANNDEMMKKFTGTFFNGLPNGVCKSKFRLTSVGVCLTYTGEDAGEWKNGLEHGKMTCSSDT